MKNLKITLLLQNTAGVDCIYVWSRINYNCLCDSQFILNLQFYSLVSNYFCLSHQLLIINTSVFIPYRMSLFAEMLAMQRQDMCNVPMEVV